MTANSPHLIYFADPMCSWCWGFSPVIEAVQAIFGPDLPIRLVMGGLRPGTDTPMTEAAKRDVRTHWEHVHEATGQAFDYGFFDRPSFLYDTDPAAQAVVLMRERQPDQALMFLGRIQRAFYAQNLDVTDFEVLADLAAQAGLDRATVLGELGGEALKQATWSDYAISQRAGVTGFPTLIAGPNPDGTYALVNRGYRAPDEVLGALSGWLERQAA
ncbi:MAG: DsbA family protein [Caulobacteraceae bacterium]|nr:DsbA family protein [Caulobacteraceae bacterium]